MRKIWRQLAQLPLWFSACLARVWPEPSNGKASVKGSLLGLLILAMMPPASTPGHTPGSEPISRARRGHNNWVLTWSDEFNGPDGSSPDNHKWNVQTGGSGWGNDELQYYTSRPQNVRQENGDLVIEARKESFVGPDGVRRNFTSARITTERLFSQKYGRFEARIQVPSGQGVWPAFWLLGTNVPETGWPECGEIDVMENVGREPGVIHGTIHGPGYSGATPLTTAYTLSQGHFSDGFHIFTVEWEPGEIRFYVDGELFSTKRSADIPPGTHWVFDHPFFLILNLAVGGHLPGSPDASTSFPQRMLVDYVRVYARM